MSKEVNMGHADNHGAPEAFQAQLDHLFAAYREAIPDPEPGAGFMPGVWRRIEARRSVAASVRHLAQSLITAAAATCLIFTLFLLRPASPTPVFATASYIDVLASDSTPEQLAYAEIARDEGDFEDVQP